ncbi:hypothetical protein [Priestia aryabhattai]
MSQIYSSCTVCYQPLNDEDKELNAEKDNLYFPVCKSCINKAIKEIEEK